EGQGEHGPGMSKQRIDQDASLWIPKLDRLVPTARCQSLSVRREGNSKNTAAMSQRQHQASVNDAPEPNGLIPTPRRQARAARREGERENIVRMPGERSLQCPI